MGDPIRIRRTCDHRSSLRAVRKLAQITGNGLDTICRVAMKAGERERANSAAQISGSNCLRQHGFA
jgi:hypothetical protein